MEKKCALSVITILLLLNWKSVENPKKKKKGYNLLLYVIIKLDDVGMNCVLW